MSLTCRKNDQKVPSVHAPFVSSWKGWLVGSFSNICMSLLSHVRGAWGAGLVWIIHAFAFSVRDVERQLIWYTHTHSDCATTLTFDCSSLRWHFGRCKRRFGIIASKGWSVSAGIRYVSACVWVVGLVFRGQWVRNAHICYLPAYAFNCSKSWKYPTCPLVGGGVTDHNTERGEHGGVHARCSCWPSAKLSLLNATFQTGFAHCHVWIRSHSGRA